MFLTHLTPSPKSLLLQALILNFLTSLDTGIKGNIEADKHAKDTAYKIYKGYMAAPMNVSIKTAFNLSSDIATRSWQRMWDNDLSGRYTQSYSMRQQQSLWHVTLEYPTAGFCFTILC